MKHYLDAILDTCASQKKSFTLICPYYYSPPNNVPLSSVKRLSLSGRYSHINILPWILAFLSAYRAHRDQDIRVYLMNGISLPSSIAILLLSRLFNLPSSLTLHDLTAHPGAKIDKLLSMLNPISLALANKIHIHYSSLKPESSILKYKSKTTVISHPSFSLGHFLKKKPSTIFPTYDISFVGRLEAYKGLEYFLSLVSCLQSIDPSISSCIVGSGSLAHFCTQYISKNSLNTHFLGFLPDHELAHLINSTSLVIAPYIQASASGLPSLVASCHSFIVTSQHYPLSEQSRSYGGLVIDIERNMVTSQHISQILLALEQRKCGELRMRPVDKSDASNLVQWIYT